jgi:UDP-N-acetyl-D-mannosaminuronic acid dehydrogenase
MKISSKKTKIAVCGLGYVGFPLALLFAEAGFQVIGVNRSQEKVKLINRGKTPIEGKEPGLKELFKKVRKTAKFLVTTDESKYQEAEVIIVAVETPVEANHEPAYRALKSALTSIGRNLKLGALVIIESTIAPRTMEEVVKPILEQESGLEAGRNFYLSNCPERLMPGHLLENILNYNRVIGAEDEETYEMVKSLYKYIVKGKLDKATWVETEIVKAGENAYRDVQIAFANEMALLCEAMGADVWTVRNLINECKRKGETRFEALRQMHSPGAGVGGHCLPKDSWLLVFGAKDLIEPKLIPLARKINNFMPKHIFDLLKDAVYESGKDLKNLKITILGYAYAGNSDDARNTPTEELLKILKNNGIRSITIQDPYIKDFRVPLTKALKGTQAVILMANHDQYKKINYNRLRGLIKPPRIIIDGRNAFDKAKLKKLGFVYKGVGNI